MDSEMSAFSEGDIEAAFQEARAIHEKGMDPRLAELDRKGNWLHLNWFKVGYLAAMTKKSAFQQYRLEENLACSRCGELESNSACEACG